jgi:hypothetical protein
MIVVGGLLAAWGTIVLWFARPLHAGWRDLLQSMRSAGVPSTIRGTELMASARGLVWMRRAGFAGLVAGLTLSAIGAIRIAVESM